MSRNTISYDDNLRSGKGTDTRASEPERFGRTKVLRGFSARNDSRGPYKGLGEKERDNDPDGDKNKFARTSIWINGFVSVDTPIDVTGHELGRVYAFFFLSRLSRGVPRRRAGTVGDGYGSLPLRSYSL